MLVWDQRFENSKKVNVGYDIAVKKNEKGE